jgi:signal transduction histidine kinase
MWRVKFNSTAANLAALYALFFCVSVGVLGIVSMVLVNRAFYRQIDQRIAAEMADIASEPSIADAVAQRAKANRNFRYRLESTDGRQIAGDLAVSGHGAGWFDFLLPESTAADETGDKFRGLSQPVGAAVLTIAEDTDEIENINRVLAGTFIAAGMIAAILAILGGIWLGHFYLRRLNRLASTAENITLGSQALRMPLDPREPEFNRLSQSLNLMLDRNAVLLENQRQITNDIAHDLRTPLTRLRQTLEHGAEDERGDTIQEVDGLLLTIDSLLRIAEIEEGSRKSHFRLISLTELTHKVQDAYAAAFEEAGKQLTVDADENVTVRGDADLLAQLLSNLLENVLVHAEGATTAVIELRDFPDDIVLRIVDNGAGIPEGAETRISRRLYRLDHSRGRPGNGLGLSLVKAIAELHGAEMSVIRQSPGLSVGLFWLKPMRN